VVKYTSPYIVLWTAHDILELAGGEHTNVNLLNKGNLIHKPQQFVSTLLFHGLFQIGKKRRFRDSHILYTFIPYFHFMHKNTQYFNFPFEKEKSNYKEERTKGRLGKSYVVRASAHNVSCWNTTNQSFMTTSWNYFLGAYYMEHKYIMCTEMDSNTITLWNERFLYFIRIKETNNLQPTPTTYHNATYWTATVILNSKFDFQRFSIPDGICAQFALEFNFTSA